MSIFVDLTAFGRPCARRTAAPARVCRFCEQPFEPRAHARAKRDYCYSYACEERREREKISRINAAGRRRRQQQHQEDPCQSR